jgi:hypothetical protein
MQTLTPTPSFDPADIVTFIVETACGMMEIVGRKYGLTRPLMDMVRRRLRRLGARFTKVTEQVAAGELPDPARPARRTASPRSAATADPSVRPAVALPRNRGWMTDLVPETNHFRVTMNWMFAQPTVKALIAAAPVQVGRVLRPLCWMFGADVPTELRRRPRARDRRAADPSAPAPELARPADGTGWPQGREPELPEPTQQQVPELHPPKKSD